MKRQTVHLLGLFVTGALAALPLAALILRSLPLAALTRHVLPLVILRPVRGDGLDRPLVRRRARALRPVPILPASIRYQETQRSHECFDYE